MEKIIFLTRFDKAIERVLEKARNSIIEDIPNECKFIIEYMDSKRTELISKEEVIGILFRDNKVPRWININLKTIDNDVSIINCEVAPDYFEDDSQLLYEEEGVPPFRVGYPWLPEEFKGKKFSINDLRKD